MNPSPAEPSQIVAAGPAHAAVVAALHQACFADPWSVSAVSGVLQAPGTFCLIGATAGDPAAFIIGRVAGGEFEVLAIGVLPPHRGAGIGGMLLESACRHAAAIGAEKAFLEVAEDNGPARRLYLAHRFVAAGRRPRYYRRSPTTSADALILARDPIW